MWLAGIIWVHTADVRKEGNTRIFASTSRSTQYEWVGLKWLKLSEGMPLRLEDRSHQLLDSGSAVLKLKWIVKMASFYIIKSIPFAWAGLWQLNPFIVTVPTMYILLCNLVYNMVYNMVYYMVYNIVITIPCMLLPSSHQPGELLHPLPEWSQKWSLPLALRWQSGSGPVHLQHRLGHHCQTCPDRGQGSGHASPPHSAKEAILHYIMLCYCMLCCMTHMTWQCTALHCNLSHCMHACMKPPQNNKP